MVLSIGYAHFLCKVSFTPYTQKQPAVAPGFQLRRVITQVENPVETERKPPNWGAIGSMTQD